VFSSVLFTSSRKERPAILSLLKLLTWLFVCFLLDKKMMLIKNAVVVVVVGHHNQRRYTRKIEIKSGKRPAP